MLKKNKITIAIWGELSDDKFISKIQALLVCPQIQHIHLIRFRGNPFHDLKTPKIDYLYPRLRSKRLYEIKAFIFLLFLSVFGDLDLVISIYFIPNGVYTSILRKLVRIPVIQVLPGSDLFQIKKKRHLQYLLGWSDAIAVRGTRSINELKAIGIESTKLFILDNHLLFPSHRYSRPLSLDQKVYDIIFVGYLRPLKRLDIFLEIISEITSSLRRPINVIILGDGPILPQLKLQIAELKLEQYIKLAGHCENVGEYFQKARLFVLTSESEGLNMAMIESMAHGVPVVVPNINDLCDVVESGVNGFLVDFGQVNEYVKNIMFLLDNNDEYLKFSRNAEDTIKELCANRYSLSALAQVWQEQIQKALYGI